jgi:enamine deaminase RidA (YjgF/YER057c/UK114 family)
VKTEWEDAMNPCNAVRALVVSALVPSLGLAQTVARPRYLEPNTDTGMSRAVIVPNVPLAHTAQLLPLDAEGRLVGKGQPTVQIEKVLDNLATALAEARSGLDRLVKVHVYVARPELVGDVQKVFARKFAGEARPAVSFVVGNLAVKDAEVALDAVAVSADDPGPDVKAIRSAKLGGLPGTHVAILPAGARVYVSGQAEKGKDLVDATGKTLESLRATLKHLALTDADVVHLKAFLTPVADAEEVRKEVAKFFGDRPSPPLVFVEWTSTLPIEIELVARAGKEKAGEAIEYLTPPGLQASPIFSRVARINHGPTIYLSGLYADKPKDAAGEVQEVFAALSALLEKTGSDLRHLAKATYYVATEDASRQLNELRPRYYDPRRPPAASKAMVAGVGRPGKSLTLDLIAVPVPGKQ